MLFFEKGYYRNKRRIQIQTKDNNLIIMKANQIDQEIVVRNQMAYIFADGFAEWLDYFSKDKEVLAKAFAHMFVLDQFFVAVVDNKVARMTACTDGQTHSVQLNKRELRKHLGFAKGSIAGIVLKKNLKPLMKTSRLMQGLLNLLGQLLDSEERVLARK